MALQTTNSYVIVEAATETSVLIRSHKDIDHRNRFKAGSELEFETTIGGSRSIQIDLSVIADATKSIKDNFITAGYEALKATDEFSHATDV